MKKTITPNADGTFTAMAGVQVKRCDSIQEAERFLSRFLGRRHADPVDNTYDRTIHGPGPC